MLHQILGKFTLSKHSSQLRLRYSIYILFVEGRFKQIKRRFYKSGTISAYREHAMLNQCLNYCLSIDWP